MLIDISLNLCAVKRSRPDGACEVCRVGRSSLLLISRSCNMKDFDLCMNCILFSPSVDSYVYYTNMHGVNYVKE
jgi:pyruvate formate-lyase activating enzyme-like uncharacterized protein